MNFFKREDPKTMLEGLDKACELLDERYKNKQITIETYQRIALSYATQREKYEKKLKKKKD